MNTQKIAIYASVAFIVFVIAFSSMTIVPYGNVGVTKTLGKLGDGILTEGIQFKKPFIEDVIMVNVQLQKLELNVSASSKDLQPVKTHIALNYGVSEYSASHLLKSIGIGYEEKVIAPTMNEVFKAVIARYSAEELISKRDIVSAEIREGLTKRLKSYGLNVAEINIVSFEFSEAFNNSIEAKQVAAQKAIQAKNDLQRVQIEAEQRIAQAKAEAESLKLKKQEVTPELVQLKQIEVQEKALDKWDGKLPTVTGGAMPFIDLKVLKK